MIRGRRAFQARKETKETLAQPDRKGRWDLLDRRETRGHGVKLGPLAPPDQKEIRDRRAILASLGLLGQRATRDHRENPAQKENPVLPARKATQVLAANKGRQESPVQTLTKR